MKLVSAGDRDKVPVLPPAGMDGLKTLILGRCPVRSANATVYVAAALRTWLVKVINSLFPPQTGGEDPAAFKTLSIFVFIVNISRLRAYSSLITGDAIV